MIIIFLMFVLLCHATASILHYYHPSSDSLYLPTSLLIHKLASIFWLFTFIPWLSTLLLPFHITYYHHPFIEEQFHVSGTDHQQTKPDQRPWWSSLSYAATVLCVCVKNGWMNGAAVAWRKSLKVEWTTSELVEVQWRKGSNNLMHVYSNIPCYVRVSVHFKYTQSFFVIIMEYIFLSFSSHKITYYSCCSKFL